MKGKYTIDVQNRSARFKLTIKRNITILKGNSATGKSTLVRMIGDFERDGAASGISLSCSRRCITADDSNWRTKIAENENCIVFIDEAQKCVRGLEFAKAVQGSSNYFVLVARERLQNLSYSVDEVYGLTNRTKSRYQNYTIYHTQMNKIYSSLVPGKIELPECVIVEDSNSGYEFFSAIFSRYNIPCISAEGNSNIHNTIMKRPERKILVIADGAAFGQEIERVKLLDRWKNIILYLPESFEWLILTSGLFNKGSVKEILLHPEEYINSEEYYTWECFFTKLLVEQSQSIIYLQYRKSSLNSHYLDENVQKTIKAEIPEIIVREEDHRGKKTTGKKIKTENDRFTRPNVNCLSINKRNNIDEYLILF